MAAAPPTLCPICAKPAPAECGRVVCGNRKPVTVDLPAGMQQLGGGCYRRPAPHER